jgi:hypothetical protein
MRICRHHHDEQHCCQQQQRQHQQGKGSFNVKAMNAPCLAGFLRREDEKLEAAQVRRIIATPCLSKPRRSWMSTISSIEVPQCGTKLEAGRRWVDEKCRDVEF